MKLLDRWFVCISASKIYKSEVVDSKVKIDDDFSYFWSKKVKKGTFGLPLEKVGKVDFYGFRVDFCSRQYGSFFGFFGKAGNDPVLGLFWALFGFYSIYGGFRGFLRFFDVFCSFLDFSEASELMDGLKLVSGFVINGLSL